MSHLDILPPLSTLHAHIMHLVHIVFYFITFVFNICILYFLTLLFCSWTIVTQKCPRCGINKVLFYSYCYLNEQMDACSQQSFTFRNASWLSDLFLIWNIVEFNQIPLKSCWEHRGNQQPAGTQTWKLHVHHMFAWTLKQCKDVK